MRWLDRSLITGPYYCLCVTEAAFRQELKHLRVPKKRWPEFLHGNGNATTHFFTKADGDECCIVAMHPAPERPAFQVHALLVHEAVHIWQSFREGIGERSPSHEFEAYSIQTISQRLMEAYAELTAPPNKRKRKSNH